MSELRGQRKAHYRERIPRDIPGHMVAGLVEYIVDGIPPGSFLSGVLANDFCIAVSHADQVNRHLLRAYVIVLMQVMPAPAWGSWDNVRAWTAKGGLMGAD